MTTFSSFFSGIAYLGTVFLTLISSWLGFLPHHTELTSIVATSSVEQIAITPGATSATTTKATTTPPALPPKKPTTPVVVTPPVITQPPVVVPIPVIPTPPPTSVVFGTTTLGVDPIPLLSGGTVRAGQSVAVAFLQITNVGTNYTLIKGFTLAQLGSAPGNAIIGLSTVDDRGGARGFTGGIEGMTPFVGTLAEAPTSEVLAPREMRLFTVKVLMSKNLTFYVGTDIRIVVTGVDAEDITAVGNFPIAGTVWTIAP